MNECYFCTREKPTHWPDCPCIELRMGPSHPFFKMPREDDEVTNPGPRSAPIALPEAYVMGMDPGEGERAAVTLWKKDALGRWCADV